MTVVMRQFFWLCERLPSEAAAVSFRTVLLCAQAALSVVVVVYVVAQPRRSTFSSSGNLARVMIRPSGCAGRRNLRCFPCPSNPAVCHGWVARRHPFPGVRMDEIP